MTPAVVPIRALPDYSRATSQALLNLAPNTARAYDAGFRFFLRWLGTRPFDVAAVREYAAELRRDKSSATVNLRLAAVRRLAEFSAEAGLIDHNTALRINRVGGIKKKGVRTGNWLTAEQAQAILDSLDRSTLIGKRDGAIFALMFGCGLRADEAARLKVWQVQQREGRWIIANLEGKHSRTRTVPVSDWAASLVLDWLLTTDRAPQGNVVRGIGNSGAVEEGGLSTRSIYRRVVLMGRVAGVRLMSHDLRRSFGRLAMLEGADLKQIQLVYGHASENTTRGYLNVELDLKHAPGDSIKMRLKKTKGENS